MNTLKEVRKYLNSIPYINNGGCAVSALAMYLWLKNNKKVNKDTRIVYFYGGVSSWVSNKKALKGDKQTKPAGCYHATLRHKGMFLDSEGIQNANHYWKKHTIKNISFVKESIREPYNWNTMFNRKYIEEIENTLNISLLN